MKRITLRPGARLAGGLLAASAALLIFALAGCAVFSGSAQNSATPAVQPTADLSKQAAEFWSKGDFPQSELLYSRLTERRDLDAKQRAQALDRLAASAFRARHYYQAKQALDIRAAEDHSVLAAWPWHDLYLKTLGALNRSDLLERYRAWLAAHAELPYAVRSHAALAFAAIDARNGEGTHAADVLAAARDAAPDPAARAAFENECAASLRDLPRNDLLVLLRSVQGRGAKTFPRAPIQREAARRGLSPQSLGSNPPSLAAPSLFVTDPVLLAQEERESVSDEPAAVLPPAAHSGSQRRIALILPLSGRFSATGQKVLRGASAAQTELAARGRKVGITAINSEAPGWLQRLAALPPTVTVVGGPLMNPANLRAIAASGQLTQRALFAFLPGLGNLREGRQAWRFFSSSRDQMRALVQLTNALGIDAAAVLAPQNAYGRRMATLFESAANASGLRIAGSEYYQPVKHTLWTNSVSRLLKVPANFRRHKNKPLPLPDFGAVFIPEDWSQSEMLTSDFYFYGGQHLLFLGTDLWSVGMDNAREIDDTYFQRSACPGAWWSESAGARALQRVMDRQGLGQADFWVALGYDFVRLAARLDIRPGWTPDDVNAALTTAQDMNYSMAPVSWNPEGRASQSMYLFAPRKGGKALVDPAALRRSIDKARELREKAYARSRERR